MKVLHVVPSYLPAYRYGGPIKSVHGLCKGLARLGHEVHVFTTNVDGPSDSDVPLERAVDIDGVQVWYFSSKHLRRLYMSPPMAKALAAQIAKFDLLHLHSIYLWPTWASARAARKAKVPYIVAPRGMLVKELIKRKSRLIKSAWIQLIEKRNLESASGIHMTSSSEVAAAASFGFKLPHIFVVPNGVDFELLTGSEAEISPLICRMLNEKPFLLFLGRINWKKGLDRLISALSYVPDVHLAIAGNDEENYQPILEALAGAHGVRDRITFTGPVYGTDKEVLLKHAAVLVLPSYSENFGNVVLEAMAAGCPVVVTPEVGIADVIGGTGAGLVVEGNPEKLGKALKKILSSPGELEQMGIKGQKAVAESFTWEAVARQMEAVYSNILSGSKGAPGAAMWPGDYRKVS